MKLTLRDKATGEVVSHPARGAWIETSARLTAISQQDVAPRPGCVD